MLGSIPACVLVGTVLGFLSGLGIGGGSLLILWLTLVLNLEPVSARGINLMFFIPSALTAILIRRKEGAVRLKKIAPAMVAGCAAALVFSWISLHLDTTILKKLFGALLIATGIRELLYKSKE